MNILADKAGNTEFFQIMNNTSPNLCLLFHLMFAGQKIILYTCNHNVIGTNFNPK